MGNEQDDTVSFTNTKPGQSRAQTFYLDIKISVAKLDIATVFALCHKGEFAALA